MANTLTLQETFNTVCEHLIKQDRKAIRGKLCAYRGDGGTKCAVGCLITDAQYHPAMEGQSVCSHRMRTLFREDQIHLLRDLQTVHDDVSIDGWRAGLRGIAARHNLDMPACIQLPDPLTTTTTTNLES